MPTTYYVAWWNLENLFDEEHAPPSRRSDKVFRAIEHDIVGMDPRPARPEDRATGVGDRADEQRRRPRPARRL